MTHRIHRMEANFKVRTGSDDSGIGKLIYQAHRRIVVLAARTGVVPNIRKAIRKK